MGLILTVIIFILSIIILIIVKPDFLYDKKKQKFKQFGYGKNKTILTLPILSIFVSVIVFIFSYFVRDEDTQAVKDTINSQSSINNPAPQVQYIPTSYINSIPQQQSMMTPALNIGGFDIKSLLEAGIKAKLMENINNNIN